MEDSPLGRTILVVSYGVLTSNKPDCRKVFDLCNNFFLIPLTHKTLFLTSRKFYMYLYIHMYLSKYITQPTEMFLALPLGSITTISCSFNLQGIIWYEKAL